MEEEKSFWEHFDDLRKTLFSIFSVFIVLFLLALVFVDPLVEGILSPLKNNLSAETSPLQVDELRWQKVKNTSSVSHLFTTKEGEQVHIGPGDERVFSYSAPRFSLLALSPLEGFLVSIKCAFVAAFLLSLPIFIFLIGRFVLPALYPHEKALFKLVGTLFVIANGLGFLLAFFFAMPFANKFFFNWNLQFAINAWSLSSYIDFTLSVMISASVLFNLGLGTLGAVHLGLLTEEMLKRKRRHVILIALVLGAIFTPPDIPSQIVFALLLIGFFELALLYSKFREKIHHRDHRAHRV